MHSTHSEYNKTLIVNNDLYLIQDNLIIVILLHNLEEISVHSGCIKTVKTTRTTGTRTTGTTSTKGTITTGTATSTVTIAK